MSGNNNLYLTLPSNTRDFTQENRTNSFRVQLPEPLELHGRWEVALVDVQYPLSWPNVSDPEPIRIKYTTKTGFNMWLEGKIPRGHYKDLSELLAAIKIGIRDANRQVAHIEASARLAVLRLQLIKKYNPAMMGETTASKDHLLRHPDELQLPPEANQFERLLDTQLYETWKDKLKHYRRMGVKDVPVAGELENALSYRFDETNRIQLHLAPGKPINAIEFSPNIKYMLGLEDPLIKFGVTDPKYTPDLTGGLNTLFVHCSIVEPQVVGNVRSEVLRTVSVNSSKKRFGETVHELFANPHYVNIPRQNFDNVRIEIRFDDGKPVPFDFGKVICKLHLRKSKGL